MKTTHPQAFDRHQDDLEELAWQDLERRRLKRMDDDCGYTPPLEDAEDE